MYYYFYKRELLNKRSLPSLNPSLTSCPPHSLGLRRNVTTFWSTSFWPVFFFYICIVQQIFCRFIFLFIFFVISYLFVFNIRHFALVSMCLWPQYCLPITYLSCCPLYLRSVPVTTFISLVCHDHIFVYSRSVPMTT